MSKVSNLAPAPAGTTGTSHSVNADDDDISAMADEGVPATNPPSAPFLLLVTVACLTLSDQMIDEATSEAPALPLSPPKPPPMNAEQDDNNSSSSKEDQPSLDSYLDMPGLSFRFSSTATFIESDDELTIPDLP